MATNLGPAPLKTDYSFLRQLVYDQSQNVLDPSRDYLFDARLARLMRERNLAHVQELIQLLQSRRNPALEKSVAEAMTINETSFFRDVRPFDLIRTELLPELIEKRRHTRTLRIWSAACSTGQEAYSIGMLILEHFPQLATWNIRIEGTDISSEVIERCNAGKYYRIEINRGLPARNIVRFFNHSSEEWQVKPDLRKLCNFRQANLCAAQLPFFERFDIVFLRNVMLYFSQETRKKLLGNIHRLLNPDGVLFLARASSRPILHHGSPRSAEEPVTTGLAPAPDTGRPCLAPNPKTHRKICIPQIFILEIRIPPISYPPRSRTRPVSYPPGLVPARSRTRPGNTLMPPFLCQQCSLLHPQ